MRLIIPILILVCIIVATNFLFLAPEFDNNMTHIPNQDGFSYDLDHPDAEYILPKSLKEASAVSYINDDELAIIQDEKGRIYFYSLSQQTITGRTVFAASADFEGLTIVGNTAFALKSNGIMNIIYNFRYEKPEVDKVKTILRPKDDAEGLTYDPVSKKLLLMGKEPPRIDGKRKDKKRAVYAYDIEAKTTSPEPFLIIDMYDLKTVYSKQANDKRTRKHAERFKAGKRGDFKPSDLAVHPKTGQLYIIAAKGQLIVVTDREGKILYVRHLPSDRFSQPEGITFSPQGDLFIVNEGVKGKARLLYFKQQ